MLNNIDIVKTEYGFKFNYKLDNNDYLIEVHFPNSIASYRIPYLLVLPSQMNESSCLCVEANNLEVTSSKELLENGLLTAYNLENKLKEYNAPVLIPILPSIPEKIPYYQQLSQECFSLPQDNPYYRIDLQVVNIIKEVQENISQITPIKDKIFLNGYSSSGVFAQRFALLHPEIIDTACIGGASGSIPMPSSQLEYPLGTKDYENLTGKPFNIEDYRQIKFRYYVGELEDNIKSASRFDEEGRNAPMHDMSYFNRSVPSSVGYHQRQLFGKNLLARSQNQIEILQRMGIDITQTVMTGRSHNNEEGIGINELGDEFVSNCYKEAISQLKRR